MNTETKTTHTPGPWKAELPLSVGYQTWYVLAADGHPICASDIGPHYKNHANAHLIAAAPQLLKELETLQHEYTRYRYAEHWDEATNESARAAIAAATER